jgi:hypothetical protein
VKGSCQASVYNPNWYSLNCKKLDFFIYYKDKEIGKAELLKPTDITGHTETLIPLNFEFNFSSLGMTDILDLMKDSVEFQTLLKGRATWMNLSFEEKGNITLSVKDWLKSKFPDFKPGDWFKLRSFQMRKFDFPVMQASATMDISLPDKKWAILKEMNLKVYSEKKDDSTVIANIYPEAQLPKQINSDDSLTLFADINMLNAGTGVLNQGDVSAGVFRVEGTLRLLYEGREETVPVSVQMNMDPFRNELVGN